MSKKKREPELKTFRVVEYIHYTNEYLIRATDKDAAERRDGEILEEAENHDHTVNDSRATEVEEGTEL